MTNVPKKHFQGSYLFFQARNKYLPSLLKCLKNVQIICTKCNKLGKFYVSQHHDTTQFSVLKWKVICKKKMNLHEQTLMQITNLSICTNIDREKRQALRMFYRNISKYLKFNQAKIDYRAYFSFQKESSGIYASLFSWFKKKTIEPMFLQECDPSDKASFLGLERKHTHLYQCLYQPFLWQPVHSVHVYKSTKRWMNTLYKERCIVKQEKHWDKKYPTF